MSNPRVLKELVQTVGRLAATVGAQTEALGGLATKREVKALADSASKAYGT